MYEEIFQKQNQVFFFIISSHPQPLLVVHNHMGFKKTYLSLASAALLNTVGSLVHDGGHE